MPRSIKANRLFGGYPKYNSRSDGGFIQAVSGRFWPGRAIAELKLAAVNQSSKAGEHEKFRVDDQGPVMAGTSQRKSLRKRQLCEALLTLIAPDSMSTSPANTRACRAEHELSTAAVVRSWQATPARRRGQLCKSGVRTGASKTGDGSESETLAPLSRNR
jgi:hypothetical protein